MVQSRQPLLVVVDIQGNLYRAMDDRDNLLKNCRKLISGAKILGLPVIVTEQNNIGATVPEITELLPECPPIRKDSFSCCGEEGFLGALAGLAPQEIILCGIEAHVCVFQTAVDLLHRGCKVQVAADAVSSRTATNREIALRRLEKTSGVLLTSTEMVLFELLRTAADPRARDLFKVIK
jgi:nicotinamidase-related amidase